jgi:hypothetical protein
MPRFIHLGDGGSLFSCTTLEDKKYIPEKPEGNHFSSKSTIVMTDGPVLDAYLTTRPFFSDYIGSVGTVLTDKLSGDVNYLSKVRLPSARRTEIQFIKRKNRYDLDVDYYYGKSKTTADKVINQLLEILKNNNHSVKEELLPARAGDRYWDILDNNHEEAGKITFYHFDSGYYSVSITIYGTDPN